MVIKALIVLTDNWSHKHNRPSDPGIARLNTFAETLLGSLPDTPFDIKAIIGGWKDLRGISLSEHYRLWLRRYYPALILKGLALSFATNNTVDDIASFHDELQKVFGGDLLFEFHLVTSEPHYKRVVATCRKLGIVPVHVPSGETVEEHEWAVWKDKLLLKLNQKDPLWKKPLVGGILRAWSNRRAMNYRLLNK